MKRLAAWLCLMALLCGCTPGGTGTTEPVESFFPETTAPVTTVPETTVPETTVPPTTAPPDPVELLLSSMTLRQKVGQLFLVRPEAVTGGASGYTEVTDEMISSLEQYPVGGFALFAENLTGPEQVTEFNRALREASVIAPFLAVDEEGGLVARLANHAAFDLPRYRNAASVGSSGDPHDALVMGDTIGGYLAEYGFNMDFAPVADVNTNPNNPVIGTRAFSSDPAIAAEMASSMADGLRQRGIVPVFKHFPGHGDTAQDSHRGLAVTYKTEEQMRVCEWLPFLEAGPLECVMVAHVAAPELTGDMTPATMSREIVTGILREKLGFRGLVITDSLEMGAVTESFAPGEAALAALNAGCDILLMPADLAEAFEAVVSAVESGVFPEEQLDEIVRRILRFKMDAGILNI